MATPKGKLSKELEDQIFDSLMFGHDFGQSESTFYVHLRRLSDDELQSDLQRQYESTSRSAKRDNPTTNNVDPKDLWGGKTITLGKDSYRPTPPKLPERE